MAVAVVYWKIQTVRKAKTIVKALAKAARIVQRGRIRRPSGPERGAGSGDGRSAADRPSESTPMAVPSLVR
jgi:hypothetical protein